MATKKKKSYGLPKALTNAKYTEAILEKIGPLYPDEGVGFAGYSRVLTGNGWQLKKQYLKYWTQTWIAGGLVTQRYPFEGSFYLTKITAIVPLGSDITLTIRDSTGTIAGAYQLTNGLEDNTHVQEFNPPLRCSPELVIQFSNLAGSVSLAFYGYEER